jgi:hypothetical protein
MFRRLGAGILLATLPWLCACDESTEATSDESTFTVTPNPAVAVPSSGLTYTILGDDTHADRVIEYPWKTTFTVNIQETAGVAREIDSVSATVQQATGGIVISPTGGDTEHYQFNSVASGNSIAANGSANVSFDVWYDLPNKGRTALITVTFTFTDDNDASFSESVKVNVQ